MFRKRTVLLAGLFVDPLSECFNDAGELFAAKELGPSGKPFFIELFRVLKPVRMLEDVPDIILELGQVQI